MKPIPVLEPSSLHRVDTWGFAECSEEQICACLQSEMTLKEQYTAVTWISFEDEYRKNSGQVTSDETVTNEGIRLLRKCTLLPQLKAGPKSKTRSL